MSTPNGYICRICNKQGHLIQNCPLKQNHNQNQQPPNNYTCKICGKPGHWIQQCPFKQTPTSSMSLPPNYICRICGKQGHWIQYCPLKQTQNQSSSQPPNNYICKICQKPGHLIRQCPMKNNQNQFNSSQVPNNYRCKICGKSGHWIQQCPLKAQSQSSSQIPSNYTCKICGKKGHWIQQCPLKDKSTSSQLPDNYICRICNKAGHWIKDCPNYVHQTSDDDTKSNINNSPPSNYICNKCKKPGHWIKDCKAQVFLAPSGYICKICNIAGHWMEQCPQRLLTQLKNMEQKLNEKDIGNGRYPKWWNMKYIDGDASQYAKPVLIKLDLETSPGKDVIANFRKTCPNMTVVKIESVQNQMLYDSYWNRRQQLIISLGGERNLNERDVFHGTKQCDVMKKVYTQGFRKEYSSVAAYGEGTYFARDASYSAGGYCGYNNDHKSYQMFQCRVIMGESHRGNGGYKLRSWPTKANDLIYDSLVDDTFDPSIFVIHENARAYPMFIIHFRKKRN